MEFSGGAISDSFEYLTIVESLKAAELMSSQECKLLSQLSRLGNKLGLRCILRVSLASVGLQLAPS